MTRMVRINTDQCKEKNPRKSAESASSAVYFVRYAPIAGAGVLMRPGMASALSARPTKAMRPP